MAEPMHDERALEEFPDTATEIRAEHAYADEAALDDSGVEVDDDLDEPPRPRAAEQRDSWTASTGRTAPRSTSYRSAPRSGMAPRSSDGPRVGGEPPRSGTVPPRVGSVLAGKYRVEDVLGTSGAVVAVEALHVDLGQRVTLKYLLPEASQRPDSVTRFLRSARTAAQLQSEHAARVIDVGRFKSGLPFLVMEDLEGWDLEEVLRVRGALPVQEAVEYVIQASEAVAQAHGLGLVHRALNPKNVILTRRADDSSLVKVLSFGTSEVQEPNLLGDGLDEVRGEGALLSALPFLSPEQIRGADDVDERADLWAMGALLHTLLAGAPPFRARTALGLLAVISADSPPRLTDIREDIAPELEAVVLRCLAKDVALRFSDMGELALALKPFASGDAMRSVERISRMSGRGTRPPPLPTPRARAIVPTSSPPPPNSAQRESAATRTSRSPEWLIIAALVGALAGVGGALAVGAFGAHTSATSTEPAMPATQLASPAAPAALPVTPAALPVTPAALPVTPAALPVTPAALPVTPAALPVTPAAAAPVSAAPATAAAPAPVSAAGRTASATILTAPRQAATRPHAPAPEAAKTSPVARTTPLIAASDAPPGARGPTSRAAREPAPSPAAPPKDLFDDTR